VILKIFVFSGEVPMMVTISFSQKLLSNGTANFHLLFSQNSKNYVTCFPTNCPPFLANTNELLAVRL